MCTHIHTHFTADDLEYIMVSGFLLMEHKASKTTQNIKLCSGLEGRIPYVLFNVYVPLHIFFLTKYIFILITGQGLKTL